MDECIDCCIKLKVQSFIATHHLDQYVQIITDCNNVDPLLKNFDLALHTSKSESGPLVLIEYIAQCVPFVAYNTGEVAEILKKEIPEIILSFFNTDIWVKQISSMLHTPANEAKIKLENIYQNYFSPEKYYQQCISIYEQVLKR